MTQYRQRLEEILETTTREYTPNAIKFSGLCLNRLVQLLDEGYTTADNYFNAAPTIAKFIEFGRCCLEIGAVAIFDGANYPLSNPLSAAQVLA